MAGGVARRFEIGVELNAYNRMGPGLRAGAQQVSRFASSVNQTAGVAAAGLPMLVGGGVAAAGAAAAAALVGFASSAVSMFAQVEKSWAEVTTLLPTHTKEATDKMLGDIRKFSKDAAVPLQEAIGATYQAISAGIGEQGLTRFMNVAAQAAKGGITPLNVAVDAITTSLNAYGVSANFATMYSDAMFTAVRLGKTTFGEMAPAIGAVLPLTTTLGIEFQQVTATIAALTAQGASTSEAITRMRSALTAMSKESSVANQTFQEITGQTFPDFIAAGGTFQEAMQLLADESERTGVSLADMFGKVEGSLAAAVLATEGGAATFQEAMGDTTGATEQASEKMEDTLSHTFARLGAGWTDFKYNVGRIVGGMVQGIFDWWDKVGPGVMAAVTPFFETLKAGWDMLWSGLSLLWNFFSGNFMESWDTGFLGQLKANFEVFKELITVAWETIWNTFKSVFAFWSSVFKGDWSGAWEAVKSIYVTAWNAIVKIVGTAIVTVVRTLEGPLNWIGKTFTDLWNSIIDGVSQMAQGVAKGINAAVNAVLSGLASMARGVSMIPGIPDSWGESLAAPIERFKDPINVEGVAGFYEGMKRSWSDIAMGDKIAEWLGISETDVGDDQKLGGLSTTSPVLDIVNEQMDAVAAQLAESGRSQFESSTMVQQQYKQMFGEEMGAGLQSQEQVDRRMQLLYEYGDIDEGAYGRFLAGRVHATGGKFTDAGSRYHSMMTGLAARQAATGGAGAGEEDQKLSEDERKQLAYDLGEITPQEYLAYLKKRSAEEGRETVAGAALLRKIKGVEARIEREKEQPPEDTGPEMLTEAEQMAQRYDFGELSAEDYLVFLRAGLETAGGRTTRTGSRIAQTIQRVEGDISGAAERKAREDKRKRDDEEKERQKQEREKERQQKELERARAAEQRAQERAQREGEAERLQAAASSRRREDLEFEFGATTEEQYRRTLRGRVSQYGQYSAIGATAFRILERLDAEAAKKEEERLRAALQENTEALKENTDARVRVKLDLDVDPAKVIRADTLRYAVQRKAARQGSRLARLPGG